MNVEELGRFEKDNKLFDRTYNGVPYWQIIRLTVYESIFTDHIDRKIKIKEKIGTGQLLKNLCKGLFYAARSNSGLRKEKEYDVICFKADSNKDKFFDYWNMPIEISNLFIRGNNDINELKFEPKYNINAPYLKANISFYIKKRLLRCKYDLKERQFIDQILNELKDIYGQCISTSYIEKEILRYIEYRKYYTPFFEKLFKKVNCKAIMVVWYYQMPMMIAYQVAKRMGIRVIELQHGVINNHEQYWFEDQRGVNNYTPDYFLAFGRLHIEWTKMLPSTRCLSVGYPFQEHEIETLKDMQPEKKTIIIYPEDQNEFELVIDKFVNMASNEGFNILMKLHPLQATQYEVYYPILSKNKKIRVIQDQSKGIYYWLRLGKFHVMANTTVGFEALAFDHTNICVAENINHEQVQPLLDWGLARGFHTPEELLELIRNPINREGITNNGVWEPNAEKNIQKFLLNLHKQGYPDGKSYKES